MLVTEANAGEARIVCGLQAGSGLGVGRSWQVVHKELGREGEECIRYIWIYPGDKAGQPVYLIRVDISRNQGSAGYQRRRRRGSEATGRPWRNCPISLSYRTRKEPGESRGSRLSDPF